MAYTIIKGQEIFACNTKEEVIYRFFTCTDFRSGGILHFTDSELNVTGKDQRNSDIRDDFKGSFFSGLYHRNLTSRSIMVLDEYGRLMDVRNWTDAIRRVESGYVPQKKMIDTPDPLYRRGPCGCGKKQHDHFICGPAMWHSTYRALGYADYLQEMEYVPGRTKGLHIRKPESDHNVKRIFRRTLCGSKSWKDQGKSTAQWCKHKKGVNRASLRKFFEDCIEREILYDANEKYRVMAFQDDIPEEEISEWAMDLAYDMDEFFRQHDPQYDAENPEKHAAKEEIYENLMAGRISALDEKLATLGQTQEDYLPSQIEKFKAATGYEEFLDVDPRAIRAAIENPDQSHVDEILAFAEQANREYETELYGQQAAPTPDDRETGETVRTPRGTFHVTDMSREQMETVGYGFHHESEDGKYLIMANGSSAFAIPNGAAPEHAAPEKMTVLVVEPMKEPYVKEIDLGLHALQAEVCGDIAAHYPFDDPVGLVLNDEGKLIGLDLNRSLRDEHGEIYDIVAGTFLVVGLGPESFVSLPPDMIQKYTEQFKRPEVFSIINGQIMSALVEPENPLRTAQF